MSQSAGLHIDLESGQNNFQILTRQIANAKSALTPMLFMGSGLSDD